VDKSVAFFHKKIFEKNIQPVQDNTGHSRDTNSNLGFTMMQSNDDVEKKMQDLINARQTLGTGAGIRGDGNPNSYIPQPTITAKQVVEEPSQINYNRNSMPASPLNSPNGTVNNPTIANIDFKIKAFNLNEELTESLLGSDTQDLPLYQNIEHLTQMEGTDPMNMLEDYTRRRNNQAQQYIETEKRQNITAMQTPVQNQIQPQTQQNRNIIFDRNNTDAITKIDQTSVNPMDLLKLGNTLTEKYVERMEERIVNDNDVQTEDPDIVNENQERIVKYQRDVQPKYIEKVHYININSVDRGWYLGNSNETRFNFQVKFNQNAGYQGGATISQLYRNVISVELVSSVLPMDANIVPFDTRIYLGLARYPYLLLRIDELDNVFRGTNNWVDKAFSTLIFDKVFFTNTLSTDYISGATPIVNSVPATGFASEFLRGFMKYNPAYFEKKKYYNNPLASLNRMTISLTDPRGNFINTQKDVLDITSIAFTGDVSAVTNTELVPTLAYPYSTQSSFSMIVITTTTYFSNRLFRIGDHIIIKNFNFATVHTGTNDDRFKSFINRDEGHIIINLEVETNSGVNTSNRGFLNKIYISPPGDLNSLNKTVDPTTYYASNVDFANVSNWGRLIDVDLQTQLLFRIVTRDPDTAGTMQPINVY
jgi:hypothetical protein